MLKIARLYQDKGRVGERVLLNAEVMNDIKAGPARRGLPTGNANHAYYHKILWQGEYVAPDGRTFYYPLMVGWGGNWVILFPRGIIGIRVTKNWAPGAPDWLSDPLAGPSTSLAEAAFKLAGR